MILSVTNASTSFLGSLTPWDQELFFKINSEWSGALGDFIFPVLRNPPVWIPLYLGLFVFVAYKFKWKAWSWALMAIVCITLTDQISSHFLKGFFGRLRPCQDLSVAHLARLLVDHCPGNASFPSSHAVNHFGIGVYFCYSLKPFFKRWSYLFLLWAAAICYAQVYVGVHYPSDVVGGAILGSLLGGIVVFLFLRYFNYGDGRLLKRQRQ